MENKNANVTDLIGLLYRLTVIMLVEFLACLKYSINIIITVDVVVAAATAVTMRISCLKYLYD